MPARLPENDSAAALTGLDDDGTTDQLDGTARFRILYVESETGNFSDEDSGDAHWNPEPILASPDLVTETFDSVKDLENDIEEEQTRTIKALVLSEAGFDPGDMALLKKPQ